MKDPGSNRNGVPWDKDAYRRGARSRRVGLTIFANPWDPGTHAHESWAEGWVAQDHEKDVQEAGGNP